MAWAFASVAPVLAWALAPWPDAAHAAKASVVHVLDGQSSGEQALPADIRRGLNIDERVLACFTGEHGSVRFEDKWFASTRINLDGDGYPDWIVHSAHPCLGSGSVVRWWVFRTFEHDHKLILAANAMRIEVLQEQVDGFRVIAADGQRYRYLATRSEYVADARAPTATRNHSIDGLWHPESKALEGPGPLTLAGKSLRWSICKNARVNAGASNADDGGYVLAIEGTPGCHLDRHPVRQLRIKVSEGGCKAELSLYTDAQTMARDEPLAWGVMSRMPCGRE